ncbi:Katanin p60 ATPase-containing subunit A-like 2 [Orchesella cincta]|uniref:Katanin p60 ATPase-containing subunit A-like 2 n=1 Tax=Orchesella cincta TaxID=48709 RepID=A0A1D2N200_ORCCI|nr:Katanin p60 ATPase-containing subunit A-like 2 [Orchesella cincta]
MTTLSYASIKTASTAKENEEKRTDAREKAMLLFAFQLLVDKGYIATAQAFASECSLDLGQYIMCANIDLQTIFIEFEAYQNLKFQRYPQYFRKSTSASTSGESLLSKLQKKSKQGTSSAARCSSGKPRRAQLEGEGSSQSLTDADPFSDMTPIVKSLHNIQDPFFTPQISVDGKLLKPISGLEFGSEDMRMFADMIQKEIIVQDLGVKWSDVVGLDNAKMVLMESLVYTKEFADFFGNAFPPWRGLLLYGPPGNGKTLLAKAVANECNATFFNISSSSIVSKWRGDSEKIVKVLFELSRYHAPSIVFFDEFDALASCRDSGGESDASRRLKSELLQQMDGLLSQNGVGGAPLVFVLAATNIPWDLDPAILRRLEKRMHVQLPNVSERKEIFATSFRKAVESVSAGSRGRNSLVNNVNFETAASITEGYSCSDLHQIVKECMVRKFRQQFSSKIKQLAIETSDIIATIENISPTVKPQLNQKYQSWDSQYGAT